MSDILTVGEIVSFSAEVKSETGSDRMRVVVEQQAIKKLVTLVNTSANSLTVTGHGYADGTLVQLRADDDAQQNPGTLPDGLALFQDYYIVNATADTFQLALTEGGAAVAINSTGSGQLHVFKILRRDFGTDVESMEFAMSLCEGVTIEEEFEEFAFFGENVDDTEDGELRRVMCVRGPSATAYREPVFIYSVHDASIIHLSTGETVEASIVEAQESLSQVATDLAEEITQRETDVAALTQSLTDVADDVAEHDQALTAINSRLGEAEDEIGAQASALSAIDTRVTDAEGEIGAQAQAITAIQTTVGENSAAISQHAESIDGLSVQWTVKLDVNGHIAGIGLASEPVDGVPSSAFTVLADSFLFAIPAVPWAAGKAHAVGNYVKPSEATGFIYRAMTAGNTGANEPTWPTTIGQQVTDGGVTWECRAPQANQLFTTGTVDGQETVVFNAVHIGDATITDAKIGNISANKVTGGLIQGEVIAVGDYNVILDGENSQIVILDGQPIPATRVRLGKRPDGDYGLEVFDSNGNKTFGVAGATYNDGTNINDLKPAAAGADVTTENLGGAGVNLMPPRYCIFSEGELPPLSGNNVTYTQATFNITRNIGPRFGSHFLDVKPIDYGSSANTFLRLGASSSDYNVPVEPGKTYLLSVFLNAHGAGDRTDNASLRVFREGDGAQLVRKNLSVQGVNDMWPRYWLKVGPIPEGVYRVRPNIYFEQGKWSSGGLLVDGFQFEELQGEKEEPSAFSMPVGYSALDFPDGPAEPGAQSTEGHGTAELFDDGGLGTSAVFSAMEGKPTTINGYGISDAQKDLGYAFDNGQILHRDTSGDAYWADKYGSEINMGAASPSANVSLVYGAGRTPIGDVIVIPNPGKAVAVKAVGYAGGNVTGEDVSARIGIFTYVDISFDGGATWGGNLVVGNAWVEHSSDDYISINPAVAFLAGIPTGDIHIRFEGTVNEAGGAITGVTLTAARSGLTFEVAPRSDFAVVAGPMTAVIAGSPSKTGSCSKDYPATTCTASVQVTCNASGDDTPYAYAWAKRSGAGAIVSGAASKTCTVSDTHTTALPANSRQTVVYCRVEGANYVDDVSTPDAWAESNDCTITFSFLRTYAPVVASVPDAFTGCSRTYPGLCTASGHLQCNPSGGDGNYSYSWVKVSGDGAIVGGVTGNTLQVSNTGGVLLREYNTYQGTFRCTVTDGRGDSDSDDGVMTFGHYGFGPGGA